VTIFLNALDCGDGSQASVFAAASEEIQYLSQYGAGGYQMHIIQRRE
jgi:hypothetical protein